VIVAAPGASYEAVFQSGLTGLVGTVALGLLDNQGATTEPLDTAGIIETPAGSGVYAATRIAPGEPGQYTLLWSLDGTTSPDQVSVDDLIVQPGGVGLMYGTTDELARILKQRNPSADQLTAMERVLASASGEVNAEIDRTDPVVGWQLQLATEVTLERAVEHWQQEEVPYGIWENALGPVVVGRDTWDRHALKLAPLKQNWGFA
jgi:hypothetical protein